jgi:hypothetical protein
MTVKDLIEYIREKNVPMDAILDCVDTIYYESNDGPGECSYDFSNKPYSLAIRTGVPFLAIYSSGIESIVEELPECNSVEEYYSESLKRITFDPNNTYWAHTLERRIKTAIVNRMEDE